MKRTYKYMAVLLCLCMAVALPLVSFGATHSNMPQKPLVEATAEPVIFEPLVLDINDVDLLPALLTATE